MAKITLKEYAIRLDKDPVVVRQKAIRGSFETTEKIGHQWFIDENEPYVDGRTKTGIYKGWRKTSEETKRAAEDRKQVKVCKQNIISDYDLLNVKGKQEAAKRVRELLSIKEYTE